jgi:hypothetical protein
MDHHYIPQFYLRRWKGPAGKLWRYRKEYGNKISEKPVAPEGTAFEPDLYAVANDQMNPGGDPNVLETKYFGPVDTGGATSLTDLLADCPILEPKTRKAWALFLNSLVHRHARDVQSRDAYSVQVADSVRANMLATSPGEGSRQHLDAVLSQLDLHGMARDAHRGVMVQKIRDVDSIAHLSALRWLTVAAPPNRPFITTDRPLLLNLGGGGPVNFMTMALSPTRLFVGCPPSWADDEELEDLARTLTHSQNFLLLRSNPQCVYSASKLVDEDGYRLRSAVGEVLLEGWGGASAQKAATHDEGG